MIDIKGVIQDFNIKQELAILEEIERLNITPEIAQRDYYIVSLMPVAEYLNGQVIFTGGLKLVHKKEVDGWGNA